MNPQGEKVWLMIQKDFDNGDASVRVFETKELAQAAMMEAGEILRKEAEQCSGEAIDIEADDFDGCIDDENYHIADVCDIELDWAYLELENGNA